MQISEEEFAQAIAYLHLQKRYMLSTYDTNGSLEYMYNDDKYDSVLQKLLLTYECDNLFGKMETMGIKNKKDLDKYLDETIGGWEFYQEQYKKYVKLLENPPKVLKYIDLKQSNRDIAEQLFRMISH